MPVSEPFLIPAGEHSNRSEIRATQIKRLFYKVLLHTLASFNFHTEKIKQSLPPPGNQGSERSHSRSTSKTNAQQQSQRPSLQIRDGWSPQMVKPPGLRGNQEMVLVFRVATRREALSAGHCILPASPLRPGVGSVHPQHCLADTPGDSPGPMVM